MRRCVHIAKNEFEVNLFLSEGIPSTIICPKRSILYKSLIAKRDHRGLPFSFRTRALRALFTSAANFINYLINFAEEKWAIEFFASSNRTLQCSTFQKNVRQLVIIRKQFLSQNLPFLFSVKASWTAITKTGVVALLAFRFVGFARDQIFEIDGFKSSKKWNWLSLYKFLTFWSQKSAFWSARFRARIAGRFRSFFRTKSLARGDDWAARRIFLATQSSSCMILCTRRNASAPVLQFNFQFWADWIFDLPYFAISISY